MHAREGGATPFTSGYIPPRIPSCCNFSYVTGGGLWAIGHPAIPIPNPHPHLQLCSVLHGSGSSISSCIFHLICRATLARQHSFKNETSTRATNMLCTVQHELELITALLFINETARPPLSPCLLSVSRVSVCAQHPADPEHIPNTMCAYICRD